MKMRTLALVAAVLLLPVGAAGCGSDGSGKLDADQLSEQLQDKGVPQAQADCVGKVLDGVLTQDQVDDLDEGKTDLSEAKIKAYAKAVTTCVTADDGG